MTPRPLLLGLVLAGGLAAGVVTGCGDDEGDGERTATTSRTGVRTITQTSTGQTVATTPVIPGTDAVGPIGTEGTSGVIRPFSANSPWNTPVQTLAVDPNSAEMMREARRREATDDDAGEEAIGTDTRGLLNDPLFVNTRRWTVPVVDETNGVPTPVFCRQPPLPPPRDLCGDGWRIRELLVPQGESPRPEFDGWFTVLNRREGLAYDLWRARRSADGSSLSYQFMRIWDLNGPGFLQPNTVSARGSGLPLFGGLILPEEIQAGRIEHALAISVPAPAQRNYVQPASSTDGLGDQSSLPEGARIRLKRNITLRSIERRPGDPRCENPLFGVRRNKREELCEPYEFPTRTNRVAAAALITALHRYGAIVVDRSVVPTLYAKFNFDWTQPMRNDDGQLLDDDGTTFSGEERRERTPLLRGNELQGLRLADFEVVQLPRRLPWPTEDVIVGPTLPGGIEGQEVPGEDGEPATRTTQQTFQPAGSGG